MSQPRKKAKLSQSDSAHVNKISPEKSLKAQTKQIVLNVDPDGRLQPKRNITERWRWCEIFVGHKNEGDTHNLGKLVLTLNGANASEKLQSNFNYTNIGQHFPGLLSLRVQVEGLSADSKNVVEIRTRREILEEHALLLLNTSIQQGNKYIEMKHFTYAFEKLSVPAALFGKPGKLDTRKIFKIEFERYDAHYKEITLQVKVYSSCIKGDTAYSEETAPNMADAIPVFDHYFFQSRMSARMSCSVPEYRSCDDAQRFFSMMRDYHNYESRPSPTGTVQDPRMTAQLLDYQKESVVWMLAREGVLEFCDDDNHTTEQLQKMLSLNINKRVNLATLNNKRTREAYYSRTSGCLSWEKRSIKKLPSTGGILADEMGLGKTIELLSLILLNPRSAATDPKIGTEVVTKDVKVGCFECTCGNVDPKNENIFTCFDCGNSQHTSCLGFDTTSGVDVPSKYLCPHCIAKSPPKPSKSTIIVVPNSLLKQWEEEIENNVSRDSLKVYIYRGSSTNRKYAHPDVLSQHDVVLTTYEILRHEIHFTDLPDDTRRRDRKRYAALPCPLLLIEWWRVCLDEAQMVEKVNWNFAKMARMLPAVNRWCVTGTPIPNSLQDLYGLICFLDIDPITDIKLWESLIMEPFKLNNSQIALTTNLFGKIFWRTEKECVRDQMRLPRQTECIHRLEFAPAERYFYDQRAMYWSDKFKAAVNNIGHDQEISTLNASQLLPFRRLRDICTHPQLDEEAFKRVDIFIERNAKLTFNVFELVDWLIKRAEMKCQKAYKTRMVALNELAGLHLAKNELDIAARQYRRAVDLAHEFKNIFRTEDVNLLHALINLNDVYKELNRNPFDTRVDELFHNLIRKRTDDIITASNAVCRNLKMNFDVSQVSWCLQAIYYMECDANATVLLRKLVDMLKKTIPVEYMTANQPNVQPLHAFISNLQDVLQKNLSEICTKRKEIFANWQELCQLNSISSYLNLRLLECGHLKAPTSNNGSTNLPSPCRLCSFDSDLKEYESLLSRPRQESIFDIRMKSWTESILNVIYQFAEKNQFPVTILADGKHHVGQFRDLQDEVVDFWKWLDTMNSRTNEIRNLLRESQPSDAQSQQSTNHIESLEQTNQNLKNCERDIKYLQGLKIYGYSINKSIVEPTNPRKCYVDHQTQKLVQLPCGHFFCGNCCPDDDFDEFRCSICIHRPTSSVKDLQSYSSKPRHTVTNVPSLEITTENIWRNPFTKVEGIVRTLLTIKSSHPNDKALVICSCAAMLQVFAAEFLQNGISYIVYTAERSHSRRDTWTRYRTDSTQVLLMPLAVASTGLNLTEANHVLLVEPYLNLAVEQQAIGRIHRLGQRKETFVHRFYVADTIEEKLVRMDENKKMSSFVDGNLTIHDLFELFEKRFQGSSQETGF